MLLRFTIKIETDDSWGTKEDIIEAFCSGMFSIEPEEVKLQVMSGETADEYINGSGSEEEEE